MTFNNEEMAKREVKKFNDFSIHHKFDNQAYFYGGYALSERIESKMPTLDDWYRKHAPL